MLFFAMLYLIIIKGYRHKSLLLFNKFFYIIASEASSVTNCANLRFLVYIFIIASEASSVTNCANLRFLVYIFICRRTSFLVPHGPRVTRNAQTSDRPVEVQRSI